MLFAILKFIFSLFLILIPFFFGFIAIVLSVIYPVLFDVLKASGTWPYSRTLTAVGPLDKCYRLGKDLSIACEDVSIHHPSNTAFLACDDLESRKKYWPPLDFWNTTYAGTGKLYALDLKTNDLSELKIKGLPHSLTTHGLGIWWDPATPNDVVLNLVNHHPEGSLVEIFEHQIGSKEVQHLETYNGSATILNAPNDVQPSGKRSFYATNDHKAHRGFGRKLEEMMVYVVPNTHIVYRNDEGVANITAKTLKYANGIVAHPFRPEMYVISLGDHSIFIYDKLTNGTLAYKERIVLPFFPDNISINPKTGGIFMAGTPSSSDTIKHFTHPEHLAPTWVVRVLNSTDKYDNYMGVFYWDWVVLSDLGDLISGGTGAAVDPELNKTVITSIYSNGVVVCDDSFDPPSRTNGDEDDEPVGTVVEPDEDEEEEVPRDKTEL